MVHAQSLSDLKWQNRLIVFKGDISEENLRIVQSYDSLKSELKERKLIFLQAKGSGLSEVFPGKRKLNSSPGTFDYLFKRYPKSSVFLIGLDGGIKQHTDSLFKPEKLFGIIDAMPMRASEIRRKNQP